MPKKYKYVNGNKMIVVNNYDLGTDVIPEEEQIVPDPLVTDVGKVLTVNQAGNPAWEDAPEELPPLTGNAGKVLTVSSGASGVEWAEVPEELPAVTSADAGDVLTVNASGEWEAAAPGGGGSPLLVNITTQDNIVYTMDKTYSEIKAAASSSGVFFIAGSPDEYTRTFSVIGFYDDAEYGAHSVILPDLEGLTGGVSPYIFFTASSTSGYPTFEMEPGA